MFLRGRGKERERLRGEVTVSLIVLPSQQRPRNLIAVNYDLLSQNYNADDNRETETKTKIETKIETERQRRRLTFWIRSNGSGQEAHQYKSYRHHLFELSFVDLQSSSNISLYIP